MFLFRDAYRPSSCRFNEEGEVSRRGGSGGYGLEVMRWHWALWRVAYVVENGLVWDETAAIEMGTGADDTP